MTTSTTTHRSITGVGDDAELHRLAAEAKAAWEGLGHAIDVYDAAMGTPDEPEAEAAKAAASDGLQVVIETLCKTPARSLRGLTAKAGATKIDEGGMFDGLRQSIVDDVVRLDGDAGQA
jgi:hypothetical protein